MVDQSANLKDAAKKIIWGATAWGGQWCASPGYAYVDEKVVDAFVEEAKQAIGELYGIDFPNNPDISRIISPKEVRRLATLIEGLGVVAGGKFDVEKRVFRSNGCLPGFMVRQDQGRRNLWADPSNSHIQDPG